MISGKRLNKSIARHAPVIRSIGHPTRVSLLYLLCREEMDIRELSRRLGLSRVLAYHHLRYLLRAKLATRSGIGPNSTYRGNIESVRLLVAFLESRSG